MHRLIRGFLLLSLALLPAACGKSNGASNDISSQTDLAQGDLTGQDTPDGAPDVIHSTHDLAGADVQPATAAAVEVNGAQRYQTFGGFGGTLTSFDEQGVFNRHDPAQPVVTTATTTQRQGIAEILYSQLGLTRTRVFPKDYEPTNDNGDPMTFAPTAFTWTFVDSLVSWVSLSKPYGLTTFWSSNAFESGEAQSWLRSPGNACQLNATMLDEEVEWLLANARRFRDAGHELPFMTVNNEPDLCTPVPKIEVADYVEIVKRLGTRLRAEGMATMLVVSDGWSPQAALPYMQAALNDADARKFVGALAYHAYTDGYDDPTMLLGESAKGSPPHAGVDSRKAVRDLAQQYGLPVWMTEVCYCVKRDQTDYDLLRGRLNHLHDELTLANIAAFDVMNIYFLERKGVSDELVHVYFNPDGSLKSYNLALYGYLIGHYSRFIRPGSVRIAASSDDDRLRVVAFERPDGKPTVVLLNNNTEARSVSLTLKSLAQIPTAFSVLTSDATSQWQAGANVPVTGSTLTLTVGPASVTTLLGL